VSLLSSCSRSRGCISLVSWCIYLSVQVQAPAGREMPADAQHELARLGIAVVGPAAPNLVSSLLGMSGFGRYSLCRP
jgi:hypothetical protein